MTMSLKVSRLHELEELCLTAFRDKAATKKLAQKNVLHNEHFKEILHQCIMSNDVVVVRECVRICLKLINLKLIGAKPLLILAQQFLPAPNTAKKQQLPCLENFSKLLTQSAQFAATNDKDLLIYFALGEERIIPLILSQSHDIFFQEFLLGNPDFVVKSIRLSSHYKACRLSLLADLLCDPTEQSLELLLMFLIWNSGHLSFEELSCLRPLIEKLKTSRLNNLECVSFRLLAAYLECLVDNYILFGIFERDLVSIVDAFSLIKQREGLPDCSLDGIVISLPFLTTACSSPLAIAFIKHSALCPSFVKVSLFSEVFVLSVHGDSENIINLLKSKKELKGSEGYVSIPLITVTGKRCINLIQSLNAGDFSEALAFADADVLFYRQFFTEKDSFKIAYSLVNFVTSKISQCNDKDRLLSSLLQSWLIEFCEKFLHEDEVTSLLPHLCCCVSSSNNLLFGFIQNKLKSLDFLNSVPDQLCLTMSLYHLMQSSESRQSRLNFISSSCISFLSKICSGDFSVIDSKSLVTVSKILVRLSLILAIDPRIVWSKYFEPVLMSEFSKSCLAFKIAGIVFAKSLQIIPNDKDGILDSKKRSVIKFLYSELTSNAPIPILLALAETFTVFDVPTLKEALKNDDIEASDANIESIMNENILFHPENLFEHFSAISASEAFEKLAAHLIDYEVSQMSRPMFVGANDTATRNATSFLGTSPSFHPSFFNELLDHNFDSAEFKTLDEIVKIVKIKVIMKMPSVSSLTWFVRPFIKDHVVAYIQALLAKVDDQQLLKRLSEYGVVLENLKGPATPLYAANTILTVSAIQKVLFDHQIISEAQLRDGWFNFLLEIWSDPNNPFNRHSQNDDFCSIMAISYSLFSGFLPFAEVLLQKIKSIQPQKDLVFLFCAVDAIACISPTFLCTNKSFIDSGIKLYAYALSFARYQLPRINIDNCPNDDWHILASSIMNFDGEIRLPSKEPSEFKGIVAYLKCKIDAQAVESMYHDNALNSRNIPSLLKYDSVLYYLLSKGLDLPSLNFANQLPLNLLKIIYASTSDQKTRSLIDFITNRNGNQAQSETTGDNNGFERFRESSVMLYFVCNLPNRKKYNILQKCRVLPRVSWEGVSGSDAKFIISHTLSVTPVTNSVYCNNSLLKAFKSYFSQIIRQEIVDLKRTLEIIFSQLTDSEVNEFYNLLLCALPSNQYTAYFEHTLDLSQMVKALKIELPPAFDCQKISNHLEILKKMTRSRIQFADPMISLFLDDSIPLIDKIMAVDEPKQLGIFGNILHSLLPSEKARHLIQLLDCTYTLSESTIMLKLEVLIKLMISEFDFDFHLQKLLENVGPELRSKISNRMENISDSLGSVFEEIFERIECAERSF